MMLATAYDANDFSPQNDSALMLAKRMAKYCRDASTIRAHCMNSFGFSPDLPFIKRLIARSQAASGYRRESKPWRTDIVETEDDAEKRNAKMRVALGLDWPCGHRKTPETTHTIAGKGECKVCRRARWNRGFKFAAIQRRRAAIIAYQKAQARQEFLKRQKEMAQMNAEERAQAIRGEIIAGRLPLDQVISGAAFFFDITPDDIMGCIRVKDNTHARAVVYRILRGRGCSLPLIGRLIGGKDHSTVINSLRNWDKYCSKDPRVMAAYNALKDDDLGQAQTA